MSLFFAQKLPFYLGMFLWIHKKASVSSLCSQLNKSPEEVLGALFFLEKRGIIEKETSTSDLCYQIADSSLQRFDLETWMTSKFLLLPCEEKLLYHLPSPPAPFEEKDLSLLWNLLKTMKILFISCSSQSKGEANPLKGRANVETISDQDQILYQEKGSWEWKGSKTLDFKNTLCWTLDAPKGLIHLKHLRYGKKSPIFLGSLQKLQDGRWGSASPHLCGKDTYFLSLWEKENSFELYWRVIGPHKNESLRYQYKSTIF